jgi:hypothetical protein
VLHVLLAGAGGQYVSAPDLSLPFYPTFIQCVIEDVTGDKHNDLITDIHHDGRNDLIFSNAGRGNEASDSISVLLNQPENTVSGTLTASPEPSNVTYAFTLQAILTPSNFGDTLSGNVTFALDGTVVGTGPLSNNTASLHLSGMSVAAGTHSLSATWPGDSTYPPVTLHGTHTVSLLPLTISLAATPSSLSVGGTVTAASTFTPGITPNVSGYQFTGIMTLHDNGGYW